MFISWMVASMVIDISNIHSVYLRGYVFENATTMQNLQK